MRSRYVVAGAATLMVLMSGCGTDAAKSAADQVKSQAANVINQVECAAITGAKSQLADLATIDPSKLDAVSGAVAQVTDGLSSLGDKVPPALQDELKTAQDKLDAAIAKAKTDPDGAKAELTAAADTYGQKLDQLATSAGC